MGLQFPPMTMSRGGLSCAVVNNHIWAIGGTASREQAGQGKILTECEYADVSRAEWVQVSAPCPVTSVATGDARAL